MNIFFFLFSILSNVYFFHYYIYFLLIKSFVNIILIEILIFYFFKSHCVEINMIVIQLNRDKNVAVEK